MPDNPTTPVQGVDMPPTFLRLGGYFVSVHRVRKAAHGGREYVAVEGVILEVSRQVDGCNPPGSWFSWAVRREHADTGDDNFADAYNALLASPTDDDVPDGEERARLHVDVTRVYSPTDPERRYPFNRAAWSVR